MMLQQALYSVGQRAGPQLALQCVNGLQRRVVAVDLSDEKLALAKELGATHIINPKTLKSDDDLLDAAGGRVDYGFDMAGAVPACSRASARSYPASSCPASGSSAMLPSSYVADQ